MSKIRANFLFILKNRKLYFPSNWSIFIHIYTHNLCKFLVNLTTSTIHKNKLPHDTNKSKSKSAWPMNLMRLSSVLYLNVYCFQYSVLPLHSYFLGLFVLFIHLAQQKQKQKRNQQCICQMTEIQIKCKNWNKTKKHTKCR